MYDTQPGPRPTIVRPSEGFESLYENSYLIRQEVANGYQTYTPYVPTDLTKSSKAEQEEFWGGFKEEWGICEKCWMLRSKTGKCNC